MTGAPPPGPVILDDLAGLAEVFDDPGVTEALLWVARGDWEGRRAAWREGFRFTTVGGHWLGSLERGAAREPAHPWLEVPALEGDGVRLRPLGEADVPRIVEGLGDPGTQYWLAFVPRGPGPAEGRAYLETVTERLASAHALTCGFTSADDELLGVVGLYRLQEEAEVGYWTHPDARGRGLTRRAAGLAVRHAFETLALDRLAAYASAPNTASLRVLEGLGMHRAGVQRRRARTGDGTVVDLVGYDLLAEEYAARR